MGGLTGIVTLAMTAAVHMSIHRTFVLPSKVLSLAKARLSDKAGGSNKTLYQPKLDQYLRAKEELKNQYSRPRSSSIR